MSVTVALRNRHVLVIEQVASSNPGSVNYVISHVHRVYDYSGPFGVLLLHMAWYKNCLKKYIYIYKYKDVPGEPAAASKSSKLGT